MRIYENFAELCGHTPLLHLERYEKEMGVSAKLIAKLEVYNPAGSVKDRAAVSMLEDMIARGILKEGGTIIEPTSGNTGIGLAAAAPMYGLRVILTMPDTMSMERRQLLTAHGAELVLTDGSKGMAGAIAKAEELQKEIAGSVIPGQFVNPANSAAHYRSTGPEIWADTDGKAAAFVAGAGTGGTVSGVGRYLKEQNSKVYVAAVEPKNSAVLSGGTAGMHGLQGIGAGFVPEIMDTAVCDEFMPITDEEAYEACKRVAKCEGILIGISGGAALAAACKLGKRPEFADKMIVVLLPDNGEHYLSMGLFD